MNNRKILIVGKLPPPYMGPSIAFSILIHSKLKVYYDLSWFDVTLNKSLNTLGKMSIGKLLNSCSLLIRFSKQVRKTRPEIALIPISQSTIGFLKDALLILICSFYGVNIVIQLRGSNFLNWLKKSSVLNQSFVKWVLGKTLGVIVLGEKLRYLFTDYYTEDKIFVVPNGGELNFPDKIVHQNTKLKILYLANLQQSKGIEDVIDAIKIVNDNRPGAIHLTVAGGWREEEVKSYCIDRTRKSSLPVTFTGPVSGDEKLRLFSQADLFVFTPREPEGHPWSVIEAMAAGIPVITTDRGAITESIAHNINGFIVESHHPEAIAQRIEQLLDDHRLRIAMGLKNRSDYLEKYTENVMIEKYRFVFDQV